VNPVLVDIWRGDAVESMHRGAVAVVDSSGNSLLTIGDVKRPVFSRSAIKFLQALPLLETGAADHFELTDQHIALACASHNAEHEHVQLVEQWLKRIGCDESHLECGAHMPMGKAARIALSASGKQATRAHNNCSGHTREHNAQQRWFDVLESMGGMSVEHSPWGYDGCGIPTLAMPLHNIALALARFSDGTNASDVRKEAIERIKQSLTAHPFFVAGTNRLCTEIMKRHAPQVFVKVGAEGFYTAVVPERGIGVAIKLDDGSLRGSEVVLGAILGKLGVLSDDAYKDLQQYISPEMKNTRGVVIGRAAPSEEWLSIASL